MKESKKARMVDFDDTIFGRERPTRVMGLVTGRLHPQHLPNLSLDDIANLRLNHASVNVPIKGIKERISFEFHARRKVYPWVLDEFEGLVAGGVDIYGGTGRSNKKEWVDMTDNALGNVKELFKSIFYTPRGVKTAVSKAHILWMLSGNYEQVEYDEDDPRTILFIAPRFPNVSINYIEHKTTGLLVPAKEIDRFTNIKRVHH